MYLQLVNGYAFGETLRVLLWISMPLVVIFFLVTTWYNHRRRTGVEGWFYSIAGGQVGPEGSTDSGVTDELGSGAEDRMAETGERDADGRGKDATREEDPPGSEGIGMQEEMIGMGEEWSGGNENMYKGILWLKEKYEQYRDWADQRYDRVKEELFRSEKKYQDLVATLTTPPGTEETVSSLKAQLKAERQKSEELVAKLQQNTELLMGIYKELDKAGIRKATRLSD